MPILSLSIPSDIITELIQSFQEIYPDELVDQYFIKNQIKNYLKSVIKNSRLKKNLPITRQLINDEVDSNFENIN